MWHSGHPYKVLPSSAVVRRISPGLGLGFFSFGGFFFFFFLAVALAGDFVEELLVEANPPPLFITLDPFELFDKVFVFIAEDVWMRLLFPELEPLLWDCCDDGAWDIGMCCCCCDCDCMVCMWLCWFWFRIDAFDRRLELMRFNPKPCAKFWECAISIFCKMNGVFFYHRLFLRSNFFLNLNNKIRLTDNWFWDSFFMLSAEYFRKWCNDNGNVLAGKCDK